MSLSARLAFGLSLLLATTGLARADGLKVALDGTYAPHAFPAMDGTIQGFNVDLAKLIGEKLHEPIQIDAAQFSGLIPALQAGTYDFLVAPVTVTKERAQNLLFTEGFMDTDFAFLVPKNAPERTKLEDFKGLTIAVNKGSNYEQYLQEKAGEYGWKVVAYGTQSDAAQAVMSGRADASLAGNTVVAWAAKNNPRLKMSYEIKTGLVWAFPFRKDETALRDKVDAVLECLKSDGEMAKLSEKWLGVTPAAGTTIVTPTPGYGTPGFDGYEDTPHKVSCDF